jgi:hypothetical protein
MVSTAREMVMVSGRFIAFRLPSAPVLVVPICLLAVLSGCVPRHAPADANRPVVSATGSAKERHAALVAKIPAGKARIAVPVPTQKSAGTALPTFPRIVRRLQSLRYLPLTHAYIHGPNGSRIRHDAFLWPVPAALQHAVDRYAWNAQNPFIRGAVIQFERANGILGKRGVSYGRLHRSVVNALFSKKAKADPWAWEWVYVTKGSGTNQPERLHIWKHGHGWIWHTRVNTGVLGSTPEGTWPIYQRLPKTTMRGVFPVPISWSAYHAMEGQQVPQWAGSSLMQSAVGIVNGHPVRWQPYSDPGILWVNYFDDGRGIHYYPRASYGFPQSAGCVEEPYKAAPVTYRLLHYGVPVTVSKEVFE